MYLLFLAVSAHTINWCASIPVILNKTHSLLDGNEMFVSSADLTSTSIRTRLILSFLAIAMLVLVIFGYVAYVVTIESGINREIALSQIFAQREANLLFFQVADHHSLEHVRSAISPSKNRGHHLVFLFDGQNNYTVSTPLPTFLGEHHSLFPINKLVR